MEEIMDYGKKKPFPGLQDRVLKRGWFSANEVRSL